VLMRDGARERVRGHIRRQSGGRSSASTRPDPERIPAAFVDLGVVFS